MPQLVELRRVKTGATGPDGLVIVAAAPTSAIAHTVEFWYVPLNNQLRAFNQTLTMSDMSVEFACTIMYEISMAELGNEYATRYEKRFPGLGAAPPLEHLRADWDILATEHDNRTSSKHTGTNGRRGFIDTPQQHYVSAATSD
jgi:hypothetical protein